MLVIACIFVLVFSIRARFRPQVFSYAGTFQTSLDPRFKREDTNLANAISNFHSSVHAYNQMTNILACTLAAIAALCLWLKELARNNENDA